MRLAASGIGRFRPCRASGAVTLCYPYDAAARSGDTNVVTASADALGVSIGVETLGRCVASIGWPQAMRASRACMSTSNPAPPLINLGAVSIRGPSCDAAPATPECDQPRVWFRCRFERRARGVPATARGARRSVGKISDPSSRAATEPLERICVEWRS